MSDGMLSEAEIRSFLALVDEITPGPWDMRQDKLDFREYRNPDEQFAVIARTAAPALAQEVLDLRTRIAALEGEVKRLDALSREFKAVWDEASREADKWATQYHAALQRAEAAEASVAVLTEHLRGIADEFALRADWTVDSRHWAQDEALARGIREAIEDPPTAAVALQAKAGLADRMAERLAEEVAGALDGLVGGAVGRLGTFLVGGQCNYCGRGESTAHYGPEGIIHNETCAVKKGQEALAAYRAATAPADGGGQG